MSVSLYCLMLASKFFTSKLTKQCAKLSLASSPSLSIFCSCCSILRSSSSRPEVSFRMCWIKRYNHVNYYLGSVYTQLCHSWRISLHGPLARSSLTPRHNFGSSNPARSKPGVLQPAGSISSTQTNKCREIVAGAVQNIWKTPAGPPPMDVALLGFRHS